MKRRSICVVTTSRADFGLLLGLMKEIRADRSLRLQVVAGGMHLAPEFGFTRREIAANDIRVDREVHLLLSGDSAVANAKSVGIGALGFADAFAQLKPDLLVLLGDRFELLAAASAAVVLRIPIAHLHGGERTEGVIDECVRHAVTKMSALHFSATAEYRRRIIQMGESPRRVFHVGAPGLDQLHRGSVPRRAALEKELRICFDRPVGLVTYHPVPVGKQGVETQAAELLGAILQSEVEVLFTMANADAHGAELNRRFREFCEKDPTRYRWIPHLGHARYLGCLRHCALMIGNSSSGLVEAGSFRLPVVNIGTRQKGRVRGANVIDVPCSAPAILKGIRQALDPDFRRSLKRVRNPYDRYRDGRTSWRIKEVLKRAPARDVLLAKQFHDLP